MIASVEKPFPEWEAGRMDPVGWSNAGTLPFLLPPAFPFLPGHIYYFTWVITSSSAHGGVGGGKEMTLAFFAGTLGRAAEERLALRAQ